MPTQLPKNLRTCIKYVYVYLCVCVFAMEKK